MTVVRTGPELSWKVYEQRQGGRVGPSIEEAIEASGVLVRPLHVVRCAQVTIVSTEPIPEDRRRVVLERKEVP